MGSSFRRLSADSGGNRGNRGVSACGGIKTGARRVPVERGQIVSRASGGCQHCGDHCPEVGQSAVPRRSSGIAPSHVPLTKRQYSVNQQGWPHPDGGASAGVALRPHPGDPPTPQPPSAQPAYRRAELKRCGDMETAGGQAPGQGARPPARGPDPRRGAGARPPRGHHRPFARVAEGRTTRRVSRALRPALARPRSVPVRLPRAARSGRRLTPAARGSPARVAGPRPGRSRRATGRSVGRPARRTAGQRPQRRPLTGLQISRQRLRGDLVPPQPRRQLLVRDPPAAPQDLLPCGMGVPPLERSREWGSACRASRRRGDPSEGP